VQVTEEAAQRRHDQLGAGTAQTFGFAPDELVDVPSRQTGQIDFPGTEALVEKGTHNGQVVPYRGGADRPLFDQEAFVRACDSLKPAVAWRGAQGGRHAVAVSQVRQQLPTGGRVASARLARVHERLDPLLVDSFELQTLLCKPQAQVGGE